MSRKIRIGKDITLRWRVLTDFEPKPLSGRNLLLYLTDPFGLIIPLDFAVTGNNLISATYPGKDQVKLGRYILTLAENKGLDGSTVVDVIDAFTLVARTAYEGGSTGCHNLTLETIDLEGNLVTGGRGMSAYEVWLSQGHVGSEADFLLSLIGKDGIGIVKIEQIETSSESSGVNRIRITLSNGTSEDFIVRNGAKGDKMTYVDLTEADKKDLYEGASEVMKPLLATKQNTLTDTDGSYGQRVAELEKGKQDTLTAGNGISIKGGVISSTVDSLITPITYAELVALRNSSSLVAGMQYRITDYACTTTQGSTKSAGHPFDIIVTADSENTLNEEARAIQHEGDTYFADCDLSAWEIWYCLDNDATRFAWADSVNGKGVIYRMIDEWNNDVPYDFKNIQFARDWSVIAPDSGLAGTIYCYTFSIFLDGFSEGATANDESVKAKECIESDGSGMFGNNVIRTYQDSVGNYYLLNNIIFVTDWSSFSVEHYHNTFGGSCYSNTFGGSCYHNIFVGSCYSNIFGNGCNHNTFGGSCYSNTFGGSCYHNIFVGSCYSNIFGNDCNYNTFGDDCYSNTFGNSCYSNTFGDDCYYNTFGNDCYYNTFGNDCYYNTFGGFCYYNTFGNSCQYIKFSSSSSATTKYNYYRHNHFGDGCQFIVFKGAETASDSAQVQNYNFAQGVQGTSSAYLTIDGVRSRAYETKVAKNSSGELKIYCEADLIQ